MMLTQQELIIYLPQQKMQIKACPNAVCTHTLYIKSFYIIIAIHEDLHGCMNCSIEVVIPVTRIK